MALNPPWSQIIPWPDPRGASWRVRLEADDAVRASVARGLGLECVDSLVADFEVHPWLDGVEVEGQVTAAVGRICGVSLDPFIEMVEEPVLVRLLPPGSVHLPSTLEAPVDAPLPEAYPPEAGTAAGPDLAALAVETLALGLDPYPRKPGAVFETSPDSAAGSAFGALAGLRFTGKT